MVKRRNKGLYKMKIGHFPTHIGTQHSSDFSDINKRQPAEQEQVYLQENVKKEDVKLAVHKINDFLEPISTNLKFVYHEELNDYYVTIVDPSTDEVIREIPPKKMLDMYVAMAQYMGLLVDEKI